MELLFKPSRFLCFKTWEIIELYAKIKKNCWKSYEGL